MSFKIICRRCGNSRFQSDNPHHDGSELCGQCKHELEQENRKQFAADVARVKEHKRNRDSVVRAAEEMTKIKKEGKTKYDPDTYEKMKRDSQKRRR